MIEIEIWWLECKNQGFENHLWNQQQKYTTRNQINSINHIKTYSIKRETPGIIPGKETSNSALVKQTHGNL